MRVEIDIDDEEAGYLRRQFGKTRDGGTGFDIILKLAHALPRPIHVGDKVEFEWNLGNYRAVVLALDGKYAWLGYDNLQRPITKELDTLVAVLTKGEEA